MPRLIPGGCDLGTEIALAPRAWLAINDTVQSLRRSLTRGSVSSSLLAGNKRVWWHLPAWRRWSTSECKLA